MNDSSAFLKFREAKYLEVFVFWSKRFISKPILARVEQLTEETFGRIRRDFIHQLEEIELNGVESLSWLTDFDGDAKRSMQIAWRRLKEYRPGIHQACICRLRDDLNPSQTAAFCAKREGLKEISTNAISVRISDGKKFLNQVYREEMEKLGHENVGDLYPKGRKNQQV